MAFSATSFSLAKFLRVPAGNLTSHLQATGPLVAPMTLSASNAEVSVESKVVKGQPDVGQLDQGGNADNVAHILEPNVQEPVNQEASQIHQVEKLLQHPWFADTLSGSQAVKFTDPENIPLFREFDFA